MVQLLPCPGGGFAGGFGRSGGGTFGCCGFFGGSCCCGRDRGERERGGAPIGPVVGT